LILENKWVYENNPVLARSNGRSKNYILPNGLSFEINQKTSRIQRQINKCDSPLHSRATTRQITDNIRIKCVAMEICFSNTNENTCQRTEILGVNKWDRCSCTDAGPLTRL